MVSCTSTSVLLVRFIPCVQYSDTEIYLEMKRILKPVLHCTGMYQLTFVVRFYGATENSREIEMDMREMVDKVKTGQSLYGESVLSAHMQGVAHRQSRYSALFFSALPWFNFVNHPQHGVDTAKYYQQAERELAADGKSGSS